MMLQGTAPPISPLWTTVDPWKPSSGQTPQPSSVGASGLPAVMGVAGGGSVQLYQGSPLMVSPYAFNTAAMPPAAVVRHSGMSPFSGGPWPTPQPQQQQQQQVPAVSAKACLQHMN